MKEVPTNPGKWYAVTSKSGCSVSFETDGGTVTLDMQAPQDVFCAVGSKVTISDDSAILTQTFNLAPSFFKAARGWGQDPIWFQSLHAVLTRLLDGTQFEMVLTEQGSKLIVHTDRVADDLLEQVRTTAESYLPAGVELVQYNHNMEISWRDINKYAEFKTMQELYAVYPNYQDDLTSDGGWIYPLTSLTKVTNQLIAPGIESIDNHWRAFRNLPAKYAYFYVPNLEYTDNSLLSGDKKNPSDVEIYAPNITRCYRLISDSGAKIKKIKAYLPLLSEGEHAFHANSKLTSLDVEVPSLSNGNNFLNYAQINKESALRVLNSIPSYTSGSHPLTIGIHIDHQNDEEVLAAIANAEAKGWTLTVQWNGTATSAASVMRFGQLIYAKVGEIEMPDGTTERVLDWGHYVTDETGYETFRSLESAYEYFGLPMPEES